MSETLLRTKFFVPPTRTNLVPRPSLIKHLNQGLQFGHKLTLISAPAGFGKTTLVSEWVNQKDEGRGMKDEKSTLHPSKVAWLSLDENDNDPARFLAYFIAALNQVDALETPIGEGSLSMIQSPQQPPIETILTPLVNELAALSEKIILILDDYHVLESPQVDDVLTFMLAHLSAQLHLVIVTRVDPNLPMARLRARAQLTELRAADLRFSSAEVAEFLHQVLSLDLSAEDITALETHTEGWITGLQLAAISMRGSDDAASFIKSFTGSHRYILDYLIEEVLEQQSESVQTFLLQTAVLNRLTGSLCDAVSFGIAEQHIGQATLEMLEHTNLFIVPLDNERRWYRYHHLFADLLYQRLRHKQPDWIPILHNRASEWYAQNGFTDEAIEHALHGEHFEQAANLINAQANVMWQRGEHVKLRRWLPKLPELVLFAKPNLCVHHAWYLFASGQHEKAEFILQAAEQALNDNAAENGSQAQSALTEVERVYLKGRIAAIHAFVDSFKGNVPGIIQHARQALQYIPEQDSVWRSISAIVLGDAYGFKGDMTAAYKTRFEALRFCEAAGETYYVMLANMKLAITFRSQGKLRQTIETCQKQIEYAHRNGFSQSSLVGLLWAIWAEVLVELNDLDGAAKQAEKALALIPQAIDLAMLGWGYMCLLRISFSRGEWDEVKKILEKMQNIDRNSDMPPWITNQIAAWQVRLWLQQEKLEAASQWMGARGFDTRIKTNSLPEMSYFLLFDYLIVARVLLAQGRLDEAGELLQLLFEPAQSGGRTTRVIEILILQALTYQAQGFLDEAISSLEQALTIAEPAGFVRIFLDEGAPMTHLLQEALERGIVPDYARLLLSASASNEPLPLGTEAFQVEQSELIEPLSEREIEVLQLIADGHTNPEIAARLFLSLNTVKVHTRNIYSKLDAHTRTQAVARARDLSILSA